ncbi:FadR/GntR family transcriptional regulator [Deinococcus sp.]|uniref:FadR/GntR family transcriptional regulator n=1 Tax=Deinococcus sp. TaxID=47478 RepID=UPI002869CBC9|nr:FadR/GntR family transcriptional regulator [Deinococcus sp.]
MPLEALDSRRLYVQIADQVATLIATGEYRPGDQLPSERDLADTLRVSRPTVREAMIALEVRGLIDIRVGVGMFVRQHASRPAAQRVSVPRHTALEVIQARLLIEPQVAALAADSVTDADLNTLGVQLGALKAAFDRGQWSAAADRAIHETVARATGNQLLADLVEGLFNDRDSAVALKFDEHLGQMPHVRDHSFDDHRKVVEALARRNADAARAAMHEHLAYVQGEMLAGWSGDSP